MAKGQSIDQIYAGILPKHKCTCGGLASAHEVTWHKGAKRWSIRCSDEHCRCITFSHDLTVKA